MSYKANTVTNCFILKPNQKIFEIITVKILTPGPLFKMLQYETFLTIFKC